MLDDSLSFDGYTPASQPLGAAEKIFASLAGALAQLGHEVNVFNRCGFPVRCDGAQWTPLAQANLSDCDLLIAHRKPSLLKQAETAQAKALLVAAPPGYLIRPKAREAVLSTRPHLILQSQMQADDIHHTSFDTIADLPRLVMAPAARPSYLGDRPETQPAGPVVTTTAHPRHGLTDILRLWIERIAPEAPTAELRVYSMMLNHALLGADYDEDISSCVAMARLAREHRVTVHRPMGDAGMADELLSARLHLHSGNKTDMLALGVHEAQAAGVPVVALPGGAVSERMTDGETGFLAPDEEAFVNLARLVLSDDSTHSAALAAARRQNGKRTWENAARELVDFVASR
ncbi:MAG: glycosyltransferase [Rhodospirillales bacterium]